MALFKSIKATLEAERDIKPSDLDSIALLSVLMTILDDAQGVLDSEGVMVYTTSQYGDVVKKNPACSVIHETQVAIRGLFDSLLMNPKSKAAVNKADVEKKEDEDDLGTAMYERKLRKK